MKTEEFHLYNYRLEENLMNLRAALIRVSYRHGRYRNIVVVENKRREISVAPIRDRVFHRIVYEILVAHYDSTFDFDLWSCRKGKGLHAAIARTAELIKKYPGCHIWKSDVRKFFDSVDQTVLRELILRRVKDKALTRVIDEIIFSFNRETKRGIPIGNLTSQIFANIYLNELDRLVRNRIKPVAYVRYGDDFLIFLKDSESVGNCREIVAEFLGSVLKLGINSKSSFVCKPGQMLKYLGVLFKNNRITLNSRNWKRINRRLSPRNLPSYCSLIAKYGDKTMKRIFRWKCYELDY